MYNYIFSFISFVFHLFSFFVFFFLSKSLIGCVAGPMAFAEKMVLALFGVGMEDFQ